MSNLEIELYGKGSIAFAFLVLKGPSANSAGMRRERQRLQSALDGEPGTFSSTKIIEDISARQRNVRVLVVLPGEGVKVADLLRVTKAGWPRVKARIFTKPRGQQLRDALAVRNSIVATG